MWLYVRGYLRPVIRRTKDFCYTITHVTSPTYIFLEASGILFLLVSYPRILLALLIIASLYDLAVRDYFRRRSPVKMETPCLGFSLFGWFCLTTFNQILLEFTKATVILGLITVSIQYTYYQGLPTKQFKSVPSNVMFILGSLIVEMLNKYNQVKYERENNTIRLPKIVRLRGKKFGVRPTILSRCKYGDFYRIETNRIPVASELYIFPDHQSNQTEIRVNMVNVTGEDRPVVRKAYTSSNPYFSCYGISTRSRELNYSFEECKTNPYLVPEQTILLNRPENLYGRIIHVEDQPDATTCPGEAIRFVERVKRFFILLGVANFLLIATLDQVGTTGALNLSKILQYFLPSQMLIPLSFNAVLMIIFGIIYHQGLLQRLTRLPINVYERLPEVGTRYLVTDKTGTLTQQGFQVRHYHYDQKNHDLLPLHYSPFLADSQQSEAEELVMTDHLVSNMRIEYRIVGERDGQIEKEINGLRFRTTKLALFYSLGGTITFAESLSTTDKDNQEVASCLVYQGSPNNRLYLLLGPETRGELSVAQELRTSLGIGNENPTRDWVHLVCPLSARHTEEIRSVLTRLRISETVSENEVVDFLIVRGLLRKMRLTDAFIMDNPLRPYAREAVMSFENGRRAIVCTGDNVKNALLVAKCLGQGVVNHSHVVVNEESRHGCPEDGMIYVFQGTKYLDYLDRLIDSGAKIYMIFATCTPNDKLLLVKRLKVKGLNVVFTGDGANDVYAMREADLSICFPTNDTTVQVNGEEKQESVSKGPEYLAQSKSAASATTLDFTRGNFWEDWAKGEFELDKHRIQQTMSMLLELIIIKGYLRSSLQLGSFLAKGRLIDPVPGLYLDNLVDIVMLLLWITVPIYKCFLRATPHAKMTNNLRFQRFLFLGLTAYLTGTVISVPLYSLLTVKTASWVIQICFLGIQLLNIYYI